MQIISVINNKGGVGKTSSAIHIGGYFADLGYNVLLVDFDPQCNLTTRMGCENLEYDVLDFIRGNNDENLQVNKVNGIDLFTMKGNAKLDVYQDEIDYLAFGEKLNDFFSERIDYLILDCKPAMMAEERMTSNEGALLISDYVLIPVKVEIDSVNGVSKLAPAFSRARQINPKLEILGFFFTIVNTREVLTQSLRSLFYNKLLEYGLEDLLLDTSIRVNTEIKKAETLGQTIFNFNKNCTGAWDYRKLGDELLARMKKLNN